MTQDDKSIIRIAGDSFSVIQLIDYSNWQIVADLIESENTTQVMALKTAAQY